MNRRHFLTAIIASACAPAIVRASSLMPVRLRGGSITVAELHDILRRCEPYVVSWEEFYRNIALNNAYMAHMMDHAKYLGLSNE